MIDLARLKICFLAGTLGQGGAERQLFYLAQALAQAGANVRLVSLTQGEFWEARIKELGVPVEWIGQTRVRLARLARLTQVLRRERPALVQSLHFYVNAYAAMAARFAGVREVGALRSDCFSEVRMDGRLLGQLNLRTPRFLAANSLAAIRNAASLGVSTARLHHLPNVIDTAVFQPLAPQSKPVLQILAVGRLSEEKRFDRFMRALAQLRRETSAAVRGVIVGDGPMRAPLERQAAELGLLPAGVEFRGAASDMASVYQAADVLVLTSDWEGTPNVLIEAMACGVPVVATRVGGVPDVVADGETGWLVGPEDEPALNAALMKLVNNEAMRRAFGERARRHMEERHALRRLPEFLGALYERALA